MDDNTPKPQVRILGDVMVIHADGMNPELIRRFAMNCLDYMRSIGVIDKKYRRSMGLTNNRS